MKQIIVIALTVPLFAACVAVAEQPTMDELKSDAPANARAYIISPADGEVVPPTFTVRFGLTGMGVAPAGIDKANTGHHHILIDLDELPDMNLPLPTSDKVVHFGGGQTQTVLTLEPGTHSLQLLLGNHLHIPHRNPVLSEKITITVVAPAE